jgi:hypothetical protein
MADQQDRPEPDHSEDPRRAEVAEGGYAEEGPPGTVPPGESRERQGEEAAAREQPGEEAAAGERQGEEREREGEEGETGAGAGNAPGTSSPTDSPPATASGNPDAAGG